MKRMDITEKQWARFEYWTLLQGVNNDSEVLKLMTVIAIVENYVKSGKGASLSLTK